MKKFLILFFLFSFVLSANEIFKKDTEQFTATIDYTLSSKKAKIVLKALPKKGWHINDSFPVSFKPVDTALRFEKKKYKKKDFKILKETEALFEVTADYIDKEDLKKELDATVVLGVCTDKICKRVEFKVNAELKSEKKDNQKK